MKNKYRVIKDEYCGFEVQILRWYFPFWIQMRNFGRINTFPSIESAIEWIHAGCKCENKEGVYVVYETDAWHTNSSQILTAICSTRKKAINLITGHLVKKLGREKMQEQKNLLLEYGQTQGLDTNYLIREYELDKFYQ